MASIRTATAPDAPPEMTIASTTSSMTTPKIPVKAFFVTAMPRTATEAVEAA